jgi:predicted RNA-binding protein with PUA-like domain
MNVWVFQAVPEQYDLTRQVRLKMASSKLEDWLATRYRNEMHTGDTVLFWQAGGLAGIYATGKLSNKRHQVPYLSGDGDWRVDVSYTQILPNPIFKEQLSKLPSLRDLSILHPPVRGTNFKVTGAEWKVLQKLITQKKAAKPLSKSVLLDNDSEVFDPKNTEDARRRISASICERRGQPVFRKKLLTIFGGRCIITDCDVEDALEAAHIIPYKGDHTNHPANGVLLRADIHTLFDLCLIAIDTKTMQLLLSPALKNSSYRNLAGKRLRLPKIIGSDKARLQALDIHRNEFQSLSAEG